VVNFSFVNRQYGIVEGDRILREIAHLLLMNIRKTDLVCRYAGDRFVILLPNIFYYLFKMRNTYAQVMISPFNLATA